MAKRSRDVSKTALGMARAQRAVADELIARIGASDDPAAIVRALGPLDLVTALREADDEQRVELLAAATDEQIAGVTDLACWRGGDFDAGALLALLAPAVATGLDAAAHLFRALDGELRTLILKPYVVVHLREDKNEEFPAAESSELLECSDGIYAIELPDPEGVPQAVRQILAALVNLEFVEYQPELECLRHDLPSELEATALRWRTGRLADLGFAPHDEGRAAIAPLDPEVVRRRLAAGTRAPRPGGVDLPVLYRKCLEGRAFLDAALARAAGADDPELAERAALLPAWIGAAVNLFLSGIGTDVGDLEAAAQGTRLARDALALGLGTAVGRDADAAARALLLEPPISFMRIGAGVLAPLRERARQLERRLGVATGGRPLEALDAPHAAIVETLAAELPRRFPPLDEGADLSIAPLSPLDRELVGFADPAEVARAEMLLAEAERVPDLLARLGALDGAARRPVPTPSVALLTALANAASGGPLRSAPLSPDEAEAFADRALGIGAEALIADSLRALAEPLGIAAEGSAHPSDERDPRRRLVVRLLHLGRARLEGGGPAGALVVGPS
jgi:hypothetical protein